MKKVTMILAFATITFTAACGTAQGVASDAWGATKFVARQVSGDE